MVIEDQHMANENWHLSKTIPIAFLLGIAAQTMVLVWYIAGVVNMVEVNSRDIERQDIEVKELTDRVNIPLELRVLVKLYLAFLTLGSLVVDD